MIISNAVFEDKNGRPQSKWNPLLAGTAVQLNPDPNMQKDGKTAIIVSGTLVTLANLQDEGIVQAEGWVESNTISMNGAFVKWEESDPLWACKVYESPCKEEHRTFRIEKGSVFKVVAIQHEGGKLFWRIAGGAGSVPWLKGVVGPLPLDEANSYQSALEKAVTLPSGSDIVDFKYLSAFNEMWGSKTAQTSKFLIGAGLFLGGIATHGLLWIAASAFGLANGITDTSLTLVHTELLSSHVGYVLLSLAEFEKELFAGRTYHQRCRPGDAQACPKGFACVHRGVFHGKSIQGPSPAAGMCVRSPQQDLMPLNGACSVDIDCASGICNMQKSSNIAASLLGRCGQLP